MGNCIVNRPADVWPPKLPSLKLHSDILNVASCPCALSARTSVVVDACSNPNAASPPVLRCSIIGGGVTGLSLALRLVEFPSDLCIKVTVFDHRWCKLPAGGFRWVDEQKDPRVVAVPDVLINLFQGSSPATLGAYSGEQIWPGSRNVAMQTLHERLIERVQEADVANHIELVTGPPEHISENLNATCMDDALLDNYRTWLETLPSSVVIATDETIQFVRGVFREELGSIHDDDGKVQTDFVLGVGLQDSEATSQSKLLNMAMSCAQTRYFYNPDSMTRRGYLSIRLTEEEFTDMTRGCDARVSPFLLYKQAEGESQESRTRFSEQLPEHAKIIEDGLEFFGLSADHVDTVTASFFPLPCPELAYCTTLNTASVCCLPGASADDAVPCPGGRSGRGFVAMMEAIDALVTVMHKNVPLGTFECFMQGLQHRDVCEADPLQPACAGDALEEGPAPPAAGEGATAALAGAATGLGDGEGDKAQSFADSVRSWYYALLEASAAVAQTNKNPQRSLFPLIHEDTEEFEARRSSVSVLYNRNAPLMEVVPVTGCDGASPATGRSAWLMHLRDTSDMLPGSVFTRALEAWTRLASGMAGQALELLSPGLEGGPDAGHFKPDILTHIVRAEAHLHLGEYKMALRSCMDALEMDPDNVFALTVEAEVNLRLGNFANSLEDCDAALSREPKFAAAYSIRCEANLMLNRCNEALADCEWVMHHGQVTSNVLAVRGSAHRKLGALREAISDCNEALRRNPECMEAYNVRGQVHLDLADLQAAVADLTKALELACARAGDKLPPATNSPTPDTELRSLSCATTLTTRADALVSLKRYDEAIEDCNKALQFRQDSLAFAVRGEAKLLAKCFSDAVVDCNAALALQPQDPYTFTVRAESHLHLGESLEAIEDCDQALDIYPGLEYAVRVRDTACSKFEEKKSSGP